MRGVCYNCLISYFVYGHNWEKQRMNMLQKHARSSLFLFGSFSFAWVITVIIHELGHAISMWATRGNVTKITINPLSWSYTYYGSSPKYPIFTSAAGAGFGTLLGLLLLFFAYRSANLYWIPIWLISVGAFLQNGGYYAIDILLGVDGDASRLLDLGISKPLLFGLSILMLIPGIILFVRLFPLFGLAPEDNFLTRFFVIGFGIVPYFALTVLYALINNPDDLLLRLSSFFAVIFFTLMVSWISMQYPNLVKPNFKKNIKKHHLLYSMLLGILALTMPYFWNIYR